jgi:hypothetical protein
MIILNHGHCYRIQQHRCGNASKCKLAVIKNSLSGMLTKLLIASTTVSKHSQYGKLSRRPESSKRFRGSERESTVTQMLFPTRLTNIS